MRVSISITDGPLCSNALCTALAMFCVWSPFTEKVLMFASVKDSASVVKLVFGSFP